MLLDKLYLYFDDKLNSLNKNKNTNNINIGKTIYKLYKSSNINIGIYRKPDIDFSYFWKKTDKVCNIIFEKERNSNVLISGMSGSGKSTVMKDILLQLYKNVPVLIIDPNGEYETIINELGGKYLDAESYAINPLSLDGISVNERISEISTTFENLFNLGSHQSYKLRQIIHYIYRNKGISNLNEKSIEIEPNMTDLINEMNLFIKNSNVKQEIYSLSNMKNKFELINNITRNAVNLDISFITKGLSGLGLSKIKDEKLRFLYLHELFNRIYNMMHDQSIEQGPRLYIFIDEADTIVSEDVYKETLSKFFEEGRKYGFGTIIATHQVSSLPKQMVANSSIFISFYSREPTELNYISNIYSASTNETNQVIKSMISRLKQNQFMLLSYSNNNPIVVQGKSYKNFDLRLIDNDSENNINSNKIKAYKYIKDNLRYPVLYSDLIKQLPENIIQNYIDKGILDQIYIKDKRYVMLKKGNVSIKHEANIAYFIDLFNKWGIKVYKGFGSNKPDIICNINRKNIAIEYETGKKNLADTKRMIEGRFPYFYYVIIIVDNNYYKIYKSYLKRKNVFIFDNKNENSIIEFITELKKDKI